jgi:hypothetical protein
VGSDLATVLRHQFTRGLFADFLASAADRDLRAERKKLLRHAAAEPGASAGHQDLLAAEQVGRVHRGSS